MKEDHGPYSPGAFWIVTYLLAVIVIGVSAALVLFNYEIGSSGTLGRLLPMVLVGELILYLVVLAVPGERVIPPRRALGGVAFGVGLRLWMAFVAAVFARLVDPQAAMGTLFGQFYAAFWPAALAQMFMVILFLWLIRGALETSRVKPVVRRRRQKQAAAAEKALEEEDLDAAGRRQRLLTALMEKPDEPLKGKREELEFDAPTPVATEGQEPQPASAPAADEPPKRVPAFLIEKDEETEVAAEPVAETAADTTDASSAQGEAEAEKTAPTVEEAVQPQEAVEPEAVVETVETVEKPAEPEAAPSSEAPEEPSAEQETPVTEDAVPVGAQEAPAAAEQALEGTDELPPVTVQVPAEDVADTTDEPMTDEAVEAVPVDAAVEPVEPAAIADDTPQEAQAPAPETEDVPAREEPAVEPVDAEALQDTATNLPAVSDETPQAPVEEEAAETVEEAPAEPVLAFEEPATASATAPAVDDTTADVIAALNAHLPDDEALEVFVHIEEAMPTVAVLAAPGLRADAAGRRLLDCLELAAGAADTTRAGEVESIVAMASHGALGVAQAAGKTGCGFVARVYRQAAQAGVVNAGCKRLGKTLADIELPPCALAPAVLEPLPAVEGVPAYLQSVIADVPLVACGEGGEALVAAGGALSGAVAATAREILARLQDIADMTDLGTVHRVVLGSSRGGLVIGRLEEKRMAVIVASGTGAVGAANVQMNKLVRATEGEAKS